MMRKLLALWFFATCGAWGANLFPEDTGFETGVQNFRYYRSEEPIRTVSGDAAEGKSSLEIDSAVSWAHGRWGYAIKKDTDYTVSFYARRVSGGGNLAFAFIGVQDWKQVGNTAFAVTGEWKRYSCRIRTDREKTVLYPAFLPQGNGVFRIDAIQLEEGELTPYRPGEPFSIYPTVNVPGEVVHAPEIPKLTVKLFNAELEDENFLVRVTLCGVRHEQSLILKKGESAAVSFELPGGTGYYPATVEVIDHAGKVVKQSAAPFVVTPPFPAAAKTGFFGIQESSLPNSFLARIGVSYLRSGFNAWKAMEVREGEFKPYAFRKPASLFWHPTLHSEFTPGQIPAWGFREGGKKADLAKAAVFLDRFFREFQGKAEFVDFINEPDLEFRGMPERAEYYAELLNIAGPIARKYGVKLLADVSGNGSEFMKNVLERASGAIDILGPHPYCSPRILAADGRFAASPEKGEFASSMRFQGELARKYGKELLIGELGYSLEETVPFDAPQAERHASWLVRMFLIARSYPECRSLIWFTGLDRWESGPYLYGIWRTENGIRPLPAVAAYAQAAHEIDHSEDVKWVLEADIRILSFRKNNRTSYAVWNAGDNPEPLALSLPENAAARSIYGTPLSTVAITGTPFYCSESDGAVLAALTAAVDSRPPLTIRGYLRDGETLKLHLVNRSFTDWNGEISAGSWKSGKITIPRQSAETVTAKFAARGTVKVEARSGEGKRFTQEIVLPPMLEIRRLEVKDLATFDFGKPTIVQNERADVFPADPSIPWSGPGDLSHRTLLGWDDAYLYLFSEVRDDAHSNSWPDAAGWRGDSIQLGIDSFNDADGKLAYDSDDHEFTFALDKKPWCHQTPPTRKAGEAAGVRQFITRAGDVTTYRIAIPRNLLVPLKLKEGTVFGLALCFNDEDPGEPRYYMTFGSGIADLKCPGNFRKAILAMP